MCNEELIAPVSILMPVFNGQDYLGEAIESVLAQTYEAWELVIIDDGSKDNTPEIIRSFSDKRIRYHRQQNRGEANARNTGLAHVRGDHIAFLDADDIYLPNAIADMVGYLNAHPEYSVVVSDGFFCDSTGQVIYRISETRPLTPSGRILDLLLRDATVVGPGCLVMTRRSAIELSDAAYDEHLVIGPDYDFWIQLANRVEFGYLDSLTCQYRIHVGGITGSTNLARRNQDLATIKCKVLADEDRYLLSQETVGTLLYQVVEHLSGDPAQQEAVLWAHIAKLDDSRVQGALWRAATISAMRHGDSEWSSRFLERARHTCPDDKKTAAFHFLSTTMGGRSMIIVDAWQRLASAMHSLMMRSHPRRKPVPMKLSGNARTS